jgi:hypothetical protein
MARMGLGPGARRWVSLLMAGTRAAVTFGGARSRFFTMHSGVGQGSPLSPLLYVIFFFSSPPSPWQSHYADYKPKGSSTPSSCPGMPPPRLVTNTPTTSLSTPPPSSQRGSPSSGPCNPCAASGSVLNINKCKGVTLGAHGASDPHRTSPG